MNSIYGMDNNLKYHIRNKEKQQNMRSVNGSV